MYPRALPSCARVCTGIGSCVATGDSSENECLFGDVGDGMGE